jgi:enoyl-CoA hydratase/carnithine racemase
MKAADAWLRSLPSSSAARMDREVAILTVSRPEKGNALNDEGGLGLTAFFASIPRSVAGIKCTGV